MYKNNSDAVIREGTFTNVDGNQYHDNNTHYDNRQYTSNNHGGTQNNNNGDGNQTNYNGNWPMYDVDTTSSIHAQPETLVVNLNADTKLSSPEQYWQLETTAALDMSGSTEAPSGIRYLPVPSTTRLEV
uniref:Uncharacterized protein n=1 Tax=Moniliophthora roreri TaxID=221103 RepID=A0A0W0EVP9_MONRR